MAVLCVCVCVHVVCDALQHSEYIAAMYVNVLLKVVMFVLLREASTQLCCHSNAAIATLPSTTHALSWIVYTYIYTHSRQAHTTNYMHIPSQRWYIECCVFLWQEVRGLSSLHFQLPSP